MLLEATDCFSSDTVTLSPQVSWKINCVLRARLCVRTLQGRCVSAGTALDLKSLFLSVWKPWAQMLRIPRTMCNHWLKVNAIQAVSEPQGEQQSVLSGLFLEYLRHCSDDCFVTFFSWNIYLIILTFFFSFQLSWLVILQCLPRTTFSLFRNVLFTHIHKQEVLRTHTARCRVKSISTDAATSLLF